MVLFLTVIKHNRTGNTADGYVLLSMHFGVSRAGFG